MISPLGADSHDQDIFKNDYLRMLYYLQYHNQHDTVEVNGHNYTLDDICYKPLTGEGCLVTSPMGFWKMDLDAMMADPDVKYTAQCIPDTNQTGRVCFDEIGVPVQVTAIFGGTTCVKDSSQVCAPCRIDATALMATWLLNNDEFSKPIAEAWEKHVFIRNLKTFNHLTNYHDKLPDGVEYNEELWQELSQSRTERMLDLKIDYLAERAIPDELVELGAQNIGVVIISYCLMVVYVGMSIGYFPNPVHSRFVLGIAGVLVVLCSLAIAIGITLYADIPMSLISSEVVPFLVLAIGVDNMFIIVRAEKEVPSSVRSMENRVALALKEIGPSIFTAAFCEALAFFVGMLTKVPALYSFCLVAALAVIADFILQITLFCAILVYDGKRIQDNRVDIFCCYKRQTYRRPRKDIIKGIFQKHYVPFLFNRKTEVSSF